jgi:hypothetical protein
MTQKLGDIAARIGTYQKDGKDKGRYVNVGTLMQWDDGSQTILLDPIIDWATLFQLQRLDSKARQQPPRDKIALQVFVEGDSGATKPATDRSFDDPSTPF